MHWAVLFLTVALAGLLPWAARRSARFERTTAVALALILTVNSAAYAGWRIHTGQWDLRYDLPMEFCNWSAIVTVLTLLVRNRTLAELSYFWVMSGSIQGVITPDLPVQFPHIYFFIFFIAHSGLVVAAAYVVIGMRLPPRPGAIGRTVLYTQVYFVAALLLDWGLETNYGYLMRKPTGPSLLDALGPWPFYLLSMQGIGLILVCLLYLPFFLRRWKGRYSVAGGT